MKNVLHNDDEADDCRSTQHENSVNSSIDVKSTAVVKYSAVDSPASFALLKCNTDLNLPPANWLSSSVESYGLKYVISSSTGFSSFRMADIYPDYVGQMDVISDANNIKKLLKLPYSSEPVSLFVHRIKKTLLIDDFEIRKCLFKSASGNFNNTWGNLLLERVVELSQSISSITADESKCRNVLQQENLVSKFLYHSIGPVKKKDVNNKSTFNENIDEVQSSVPEYPPLPEANIIKELPDNKNKHSFIRNVEWTFEDIHMLLGTDMPIFGGGTHPCVSLRLNDMNKPISILTGIDYWLDNLMSNVPEVAMCYHIDGIVQKYELIKTEDLPCMKDSQFSPTLIKDVAQNILSFLKTNATKAGHTYWLLKGKDDEVVKLYDLTSLSSSSMADNTQNPFTLPVALLLYRVARNMKHQQTMSKEEDSSPTCANERPNSITIRMLLRNCINLLPVEKYPHIVMSSHYMFADSLVPRMTDPAAPKFDDELYKDIDDVRRKTFDEGVPFDTEKEGTAVVDVQVKNLCLTHAPSRSYDDGEEIPSTEEDYEIIMSLENRCKLALNHVADGLACMKHFTASPESNKSEADQPRKVNPNEPIPMPYGKFQKSSNTETKIEPKKSQSKKKKTKKNIEKEIYDDDISIGQLLCTSFVQSMPTWQHPPGADDIKAWKNHLRILLYEKASLVYATLAEHEYNTESYGKALKHIIMVMECRAQLDSNDSGNNMLISLLLGRAGDCCFKISQKWGRSDEYRSDFIESETFDDKMKAAMCTDGIIHCKEVEFLPSKITTMSEIMTFSWMCYSKALTLETREKERNNLHRRLGNICNELGVFYMKEAQKLLEDPKITKAQLEARFAVCKTHLENGIKAFKEVNDECNLALLYSNTGRLMRLIAHCHSEQNCPLNQGSKQYLMKALSSYESALGALNYRRLNPQIWDTVSFEMSTTVYNMATLLQDYPPPKSSVNYSDIERELTDYLYKALKYCDFETPGPNQPIYQYRAADIYCRLARLYHSSYRQLDADSHRRGNVLKLCLSNYDKAIKLFSMLEQGVELLRINLEREAVFAFIAEESVSTVSKIKSYQLCLNILLQCEEPIRMVRNTRDRTVFKSEYTGLDDKPSSQQVKKTGKDDALIASKVSRNMENGDCQGVVVPVAAAATSKIDKQIKENESVIEGDGAVNTTTAADVDDEVPEELKLVELIEARLQFILRSLIKQCSMSPKHANIVSKYKNLYGNLLRSSTDKDVTLEQRLLNVISQYNSVKD